MQCEYDVVSSYSNKGLHAFNVKLINKEWKKILNFVKKSNISGGDKELLLAFINQIRQIDQDEIKRANTPFTRYNFLHPFCVNDSEADAKIIMDEYLKIDDEESIDEVLGTLAESSETPDSEEICNLKS